MAIPIEEYGISDVESFFTIQLLDKPTAANPVSYFHGKPSEASDKNVCPEPIECEEFGPIGNPGADIRTSTSSREAKEGLRQQTAHQTHPEDVHLELWNQKNIGMERALGLAPREKLRISETSSNKVASVPSPRPSTSISPQPTDGKSPSCPFCRPGSDVYTAERKELKRLKNKRKRIARARATKKHIEETSANLKLREVQALLARADAKFKSAKKMRREAYSMRREAGSVADDQRT
jgi:hypothetical protein